MGDNGKENGRYYNGLYGWLSKLWSLSGYPKYSVPYYNRDPKTDHNLDNPHVCLDLKGLRVQGSGGNITTQTPKP